MIDPEGVAPVEGGEAVAGFVRGVTPERLRLLDTQAVLDHPLFGAPGEEQDT